MITVIAICLILSLFPAASLAASPTFEELIIPSSPLGVQIIRHSVTSATVDWEDVPGAEGYEVFRAVNGGNYASVGATNLSVFFDATLETEQTYQYKIRAYQTTNGMTVYSDWSGETSFTTEFTHYYQGDSAWKFGAEVKSKACVITAYATVINNMGIEATPRTVFKSNGNRTTINMSGLKDNFGVEAVCALADDSELLAGFDGRVTKIIKPSVNGTAAVREALARHPEGVILYFKKGSKAHAIVACKVEGDTIYYSDPGRDKGRLLTFNETWVSYHHHMTFANLSDMIALDPRDDYSLIS